jgi:hypothetical protein
MMPSAGIETARERATMDERPETGQAPRPEAAPPVDWTSGERTPGESTPPASPPSSPSPAADDVADWNATPGTSVDSGSPVDWQAAGPTSPTPGRKKLVYVGLAVAVVVLYGLIRTITAGSLSNDPYDVATREVGQKLLAMPEFKARYGDVTSEDQAYQIGQEIALKGIPRLGDADLLRYWQLTNKMIGVADPAACGRIFKQTAGAEDAKKTARALDLESFRQLLDVTLIAFQADLRGDPVRPAPSGEALTTAFLALQTSTGPAMADVGAKLNDKSASDADVCTAGRSFLGAVLALGEPDRTVIARYMIASAAGL